MALNDGEDSIREMKAPDTNYPLTSPQDSGRQHRENLTAALLPTDQTANFLILLRSDSAPLA